MYAQQQLYLNGQSVQKELKHSIANFVRNVKYTRVHGQTHKHTNIQSCTQACMPWFQFGAFVHACYTCARMESISLSLLLFIALPARCISCTDINQVYFSSRMFWGEKNAHFNYSFHWSVTNSLFSQFLSLQTIYLCF